jgi:hypothetical protein
MQAAVKRIEMYYDEEDDLDHRTIIQILDAQANSGEMLHKLKCEFNQKRKEVMEKLESIEP